ncbi:MAG: GNAT family N-acetyltransferase [Nocardioides sp.]
MVADPGGGGGHDRAGRASLLDNPDFAHVQVHTHPGSRRRGLGSAMLARLEAVAADRGRSLFHAEAAWPYDVPDGAEAPGREFLLARGFTLGLVDVQRELAPRTPERLAALATESAPHHRGYQLRAWAGSCSDDLVAEWRRSRRWSRWRRRSATWSWGRTPPTWRPTAGARSCSPPRGAPASRPRHWTSGARWWPTPTSWCRATSPAGLQWGTLVRRDHRGHRLGLAVKLATLELLQRDFPERTRLTTWNAEVNAPMVAVNDRLGFRPVERTGQFQKRL